MKFYDFSKDYFYPGERKYALNNNAKCNLNLSLKTNQIDSKNDNNPIENFKNILSIEKDDEKFFKKKIEELHALKKLSEVKEIHNTKIRNRNIKNFSNLALKNESKKIAKKTSCKVQNNNRSTNFNDEEYDKYISKTKCDNQLRLCQIRKLKNKELDFEKFLIEQKKLGSCKKKILYYKSFKIDENEFSNKESISSKHDLSCHVNINENSNIRLDNDINNLNDKNIINKNNQINIKFNKSNVNNKKNIKDKNQISKEISTNGRKTSIKVDEHRELKVFSSHDKINYTINENPLENKFIDISKHNKLHRLILNAQSKLNEEMENKYPFNDSNVKFKEKIEFNYEFDSQIKNCQKSLSGTKKDSNLIEGKRKNTESHSKKCENMQNQGKNMKFFSKNKYKLTKESENKEHSYFKNHSKNVNCTNEVSKIDKFNKSHSQAKSDISNPFRLFNFYEKKIENNDKLMSIYIYKDKKTDKFKAHNFNTFQDENENQINKASHHIRNKTIIKQSEYKLKKEKFLNLKKFENLKQMRRLIQKAHSNFIRNIKTNFIIYQQNEKQKKEMLIKNYIREENKILMNHNKEYENDFADVDHELQKQNKAILHFLKTKDIHKIDDNMIKNTIYESQRNKINYLTDFFDVPRFKNRLNKFKNTEDILIEDNFIEKFTCLLINYNKQIRQKQIDHQNSAEKNKLNKTLDKSKSVLNRFSNMVLNNDCLKTSNLISYDSSGFVIDQTEEQNDSQNLIQTKKLAYNDYRHKIKDYFEETYCKFKNTNYDYLNSFKFKYNNNEILKFADENIVNIINNIYETNMFEKNENNIIHEARKRMEYSNKKIFSEEIFSSKNKE